MHHDRLHRLRLRLHRRGRKRAGGIENAILHHRVDVGCARDVLNGIGFQNDEVGKIAAVDLAEMRAGLAAEKFGGIYRRALQDLHRRESGFVHQLKLAEERRPVNRADVPRVRAGCDGDAAVVELLQILERDIVTSS